MNKKFAHQPDYAFHPGETLAETLEELGMNQKELAGRAGLQTDPTMKRPEERRRKPTPSLQNF